MTLLCVAAVVLATSGESCDDGGGDGGGDGGATPAPTRSFSMGFTTFPFANSLDASLETIETIGDEGDLIVFHFDGGVPWQEALDGTPYPAGFRAELDFLADRTPDGHLVYLAITPISTSRDGLALNRGDGANEALPPPWDGRDFDHPAVVEAFVNHARRMIDRFEPDFLAFAIEANLLFENVPGRWPAYLELAEAVYDELARSEGDLPIFQSVQAEAFYRDLGAQPGVVQDVLAASDVVAVSAYPYADEADPDALDRDYFADIADLAPDKPFAVAETGWAAEDVGPPYPIPIPASPSRQRTYVEFLMEQSDRLEAELVCWFFVRDFDEFWVSDLQFSPAAPIIRFFRDTGLFDGEGTPRSALDEWREWLDRTRD